MAALVAEGERRRQPRRLATLSILLGMAALAGCVPAAHRPAPVPPPPRQAPLPPAPEPTGPAAGLPQDLARNRVAVLVPLTGPNAAAGRSIANAANLAILDTGGARVRVTLYDTGADAAAAARKALSEGNRLILGPLLGPDVLAVAPIARAAGVPVISFSNDVSVAGDGVEIMGFAPTQSIDRVIGYARSRGVVRVAGLVPAGVYGRRAGAALIAAARDAGMTVSALQSFDRSPASLAAAVAKLGPRGSYDAVLIADNGRIAAQAAPLIRRQAGAGSRILGTELWATEPSLSQVPALAGAWYASVPSGTFGKLAARYRAQFGRPPFRLASLGYDSVLLAVRIAADWRPGTPFPARALMDGDGFTGVDGAFRFRSDGVAERALQVTQLGPGGGTVVSPAPTGFAH